ncbi:Rieske 2Fe-2S domain-containing protein [Solihabitans fulvus]|uniref:Rieske 2Fe-2S domain-containing protein n=1 Tax=Solihabitans fulvus TaxID=1892852 RepID=A0A5B2WTL4_9PSEU|nr:Rieske 2Fe-2S domain-containing protein [Solihabitans fulvus]KAA2254042.1 Rieske 2Fe-2S domain-containing protein [Solihabitans fulvus]
MDRRWARELASRLEWRGRHGDEALVPVLHPSLTGGAGRAPSGRDSPPLAGGSRRRFVRGASIAAAAVATAVGFGLDRLVIGGQRSVARRTGTAEPTLEPYSGQWRFVAAGKDLPEGGVCPFDLGAVVGFVERADGTVRGIAGVCTHLGCRLMLDTPARQLSCPCHNAAFSMTGAVLRHQLPVPPPVLPRLLVREAGGVIQVFVP